MPNVASISFGIRESLAALAVGIENESNFSAADGVVCKRIGLPFIAFNKRKGVSMLGRP